MSFFFPRRKKSLIERKVHLGHKDFVCVSIEVQVGLLNYQSKVHFPQLLTRQSKVLLPNPSKDPTEADTARRRRCLLHRPGQQAQLFKNLILNEIHYGYKIWSQSALKTPLLDRRKVEQLWQQGIPG